MRLKLDENIGPAMAQVLRDGGHDVEDVHLERLCGARDDRVLAAATAEDRVLVTLDLDFADSVRFPPRSFTGIVVLRVPGRQDRTRLLAATCTLADALARPHPERVGPRRYLWIVEIGRVRVHQSRDDPMWPDEFGEESPEWAERVPARDGS